MSKCKILANRQYSSLPVVFLTIWLLFLLDCRWNRWTTAKRRCGTNTCAKVWTQSQSRTRRTTSWISNGRRRTRTPFRCTSAVRKWSKSHIRFADGKTAVTGNSNCKWSRIVFARCPVRNGGSETGSRWGRSSRIWCVANTAGKKKRKLNEWTVFPNRFSTVQSLSCTIAGPEGWNSDPVFFLPAPRATIVERYNCDNNGCFKSVRCAHG